MPFVEIVPAGAGKVSAVVNGKIRSTGNSATIVLVDVAKRYPPGTTLFAPQAMTHCMKAGDIASRGDINSAAVPAYASTKR
jgi:hypothetical protein